MSLCKQWKQFVVAMGMVAIPFVEASTLQDVRFAELPGERFEVRLDFDDLPAEPQGYTIERPARIVLDFADVDNTLATKKFPLAFESADSAIVLTSGGRTRLILNLSELQPYTTSSDGNTLVLEVGQKLQAEYLERSASLTDSIKAETNDFDAAIKSVDFRRGVDGEGKITIGLTEPAIDIDVDQQGGSVNVSFYGAQLPAELRRNLDVVDFATPVTNVNAGYDGANTQFEIKVNGEYDYLAYQADDEYVISIKPLTEQEAEERRAKFAFSGDKLSLNFQDIEVRAVLQLIADFTSLNLVASDTVGGNITLRLDNVPWDQALDLVLKTKGLDKRQIGNVLMVAPAAEIAERERQELETQKQLQELAPLVTEYIRIRYASAVELFELFGGAGGGAGGAGGGGAGGAGQGTSTASILSERGSAIVDERTNSIILTDTADKIEEFLRLVEQVDIPIRQVMIEARIVIANTDFRKEMGVRWAGDAFQRVNGDQDIFEASGSLGGFTAADGQGPEGVFIDSDGDGISDDDRDLFNSNLVDLGIADPAGSIALNILTDNILLGFELNALQDSGFAEIVSQPKVITGDKQQAHIESGTEIPFQEASSSGATTTSFKDAVLKLDVTPQITPDDHIILDLIINQDSVGEIDLASGIPTIDVTELETQVLVANGQTVVLGGIFQTDRSEGETKVPLLGDIPYVGNLFKQKIKREDKRELLIFITPKILSDQLVR